MHGKKYSWHETTALVLLGPTFLPWSILLEAVDELPNDTLSGRIGKVVASHAAVARSIPAEVALIYTMHETLRGYCP